MSRNAISLFCSSGIGDLGLRANGVKTVIGCDIMKDRMGLFLKNYPDAKGFCGDIWGLKEEIIKFYNSKFKEPPFIILATPPCQGMSSNGMGTILRNLREGIRPEFDERNRLVIPAVDIVKALGPKWCILENVPNMINTVIQDGDNDVINIMDYVRRELGESYDVIPNVVDAADYGVPQHRKRLITILHRRDVKLISPVVLPEHTHGKGGRLFVEPWVTLRDAISNLPVLSARRGENCDKNIPLHKVPLLDAKKLFWVSNTPEGETALNNQCVNPECLYQGNRTHGASYDSDGINKSNSDTPLYCEKCGALLPRPYTEDKKTGVKRFMKAFTSAYKRMSWDEPASTLTQNFQYACSDNKLHPNQDRVLSLYEGMIIQTISRYDYSFVVNGDYVSDSLIRDTIGESVPPLLMDKIVRHLISLEKM